MKKVIAFSISGFALWSFFHFTIFSKSRVPDSSKGFALVELFTSEGCSSCPAADEAVIQLVKDFPEQVYVLGYHVDYWNYIGWKDEFSSAVFTQRQQEYGSHFGLSSVYTPEIVVNGESEFVGSKKTVLVSVVKKALEKNPSAELSLSINKENASTLRVKYEANVSEASTLNIALVQLQATTAVKRGENKGKSLHHINIVRSLKSIPVDKSAKAVIALNLPSDLSMQDVEVVAFIQDKKTWNVKAAAAGKVN